MKTKRSKATDISQKVKMEVWERDNSSCILCGSPQAMPNAHYIPRSKGGLGIPENIVTLCNQCHFNLDQTVQRKKLLKIVKLYLEDWYPGFTDEKRIYRREI